MNKTKIQWADYSWNPVTGCLNDCSYCYARRIAATRFADTSFLTYVNGEKPKHLAKVPYPYAFLPTLHPERLNQPSEVKEGQRVFVCSMGELFGPWVPKDWISHVFTGCLNAPQHTYLFLTKYPERIEEVVCILEKELLQAGQSINAWFGASATNNKDLLAAYESEACWLSIEPLHEKLYTDELFTSDMYGGGDCGRWGWVVIGAETGNRKGKIVPERKWIEDIVGTCSYYEIPVFMKDSLKDAWGEPLLKELPEGLQKVGKR